MQITSNVKNIVGSTLHVSKRKYETKEILYSEKVISSNTILIYLLYKN